MAVEENFLEHVPLHCLSSTTIQNLGVLLDPSALESDIRRLADVLGYDYAFIINLEDRGDKTKYFFETWWCLRPDFTVLKLKECLEIMEREDIMTDVWPQIENDARIWNRQNQEKPPPVNPRIESENDARVWNKQNQENPPPVNPRTESDDSWKLTIHDVDQTKPAQYNACLCYEEEDFEVANTFVRELEQISSDLKFFIPHHHVMPGKYLYDCVAQVIEERCNKKVVIILPRTEFKDATCDFALQYARALDPSARQGYLIPVYGTKDIRTPRVLVGISGIRMFMKITPLLWYAVTNRLGVRLSSHSSDGTLGTESNPLSLSGGSHQFSTSSSDSCESDDRIIADVTNRLFNFADTVSTEHPSTDMQDALPDINDTVHKPKGANDGKKEKKKSAVLKLVSNVFGLHRKQKKRADESSKGSVTHSVAMNAFKSKLDDTCASDSVSDNGCKGVEHEEYSDCESSNEKDCNKTAIESRSSV